MTSEWVDLEFAGGEMKKTEMALESVWRESERVDVTLVHMVPKSACEGDTCGLVLCFLFLCRVFSSTCTKVFGDLGERGAGELIESESGGGGALRVVRPMSLLKPNPEVVFSFSTLFCPCSYGGGGGGMIDSFDSSSCSLRFSFSTLLPLDKNPTPSS